MSYDSSSTLKDFPVLDPEKEITVIAAITKYLKTRQHGKKKLKNSPETWILNRFRAYVESNLPKNIKVKEITDTDFENFSDSFKLSVGLKTSNSYRSRMKRFRRYIDLCMGIAEVKAKKNRKPENNPRLVNLELEQKLADTKKELTTKDEIARLRWKTIEEKDAEIKKKDDLINGYKSEKRERMFSLSKNHQGERRV